jgi:predicted Ser/Thr protein kinase
MIGRLISGKYRLYDEVGSGGFATVYLGRNINTNEIVAVKVLGQQFTAEPHYVERFQREATMAQRLQHPNIVRILDHGVEDGVHFLVMEFVEGLTLEQIMQRRGSLSLQETLSYVEQACAGLQAAYKVGIVHRDIKPANLMITPAGTVKIMDFGIARMESMTGLTQSGVFMGTPRYISPEMAQGSSTDIRSDLYALGLLTYEMLAGAPPFDGSNPWAVLRMQIEGQPTPIRQLRPEVPRWLEAIVLRALAKDPAQRFQTPAQMLAALQEQTRRPGRVASPMPMAPSAEATLVVPPRRQRRASLGLVLGLAAVVVAVTVGLVALYLLTIGRGAFWRIPTPTPIVAQAPVDAPTPLAMISTMVVTSTPVDVAAPTPLESTPTNTSRPLAETPPVINTPLPTETATSAPTSTRLPTDTARPTDTPLPTLADTLEPTVAPTPAPTNTPKPSDTPASPPAPPISGRIAFSAAGNLYIVDAATGQNRVSPIAGMRQPDFRADGELIIANGEGADKLSLWTIDANTGAFAREQTAHPDDFHPFWSPDGGRFTYDSLHHGLTRRGPMLYTQAMTGRARKEPEVTLGHSAEQIRGTSPVWMQNDWIAFTGCDYFPGGTGGSKCGIFSMPSWGGEPHLVHSDSLTARATDNHASQLVYMSQGTGDWEVYIIPVQGGTGRNLSNSPGTQDGLPTFSPDGKWVAFASNRDGWAIWAVRPDGTGLKKLFGLPAPLTGEWTDEHISWGP